MTQAPGAKPSAALSPFEKQVHNPSVGRSVAATCVHELLHKGTFERFCLDPGFAKEENAFLSYYSVTPGVLFLMRRILNGKITSPQVPRPKQHRLVHLRRNE